jgi:hypothetical protein
MFLMSSAPLEETPKQYIIPGSTRSVSDEAYKELVDFWERFKEAQNVVMVRDWAAIAQVRFGCRESSLMRPHTGGVMSCIYERILRYVTLSVYIWLWMKCFRLILFVALLQDWREVHARTHGSFKMFRGT